MADVREMVLPVGDEAWLCTEVIGVDQAHVVGLSMGGGVAQRLGIDHRDRVATLTLMSTSPIDGEVGGLPGPTPEIQATFSGDEPEPAWDEREAVIDHIVEGERPHAGPGTSDEPRLRSLAGRVFDRTEDIAASMTNHFLLDAADVGDHRLSRLGGGSDAGPARHRGPDVPPSPRRG